METTIETRTSGIWQLSSTLLVRGGACVLVDPGYFPRELAAFAERVAGLSLEALVYTHGHWDHVLGHLTFAKAPVVCSEVLAGWIAADAIEARGFLEEARRFDSQWYVERPAPYRWPAGVRGLRDGERLSPGAIGLQALLLPGHSVDGLGLLVEDAATLLAGDYLSPCEIPFVDDAAAYRGTLERLLGLLEHEIEAVVPGHGPRLGREEARRIAAEDLAYLERLLEAGAKGDLEGARAMALPRAAGVEGMRGHHLENLVKVGLGEPGIS